MGGWEGWCENVTNWLFFGVSCHPVTYIVDTVYITSHLIQIEWYIVYRHVHPRLAVLSRHTAKSRRFTIRSKRLIQAVGERESVFCICSSLDRWAWWQHFVDARNKRKSSVVLPRPSLSRLQLVLVVRRERNTIHSFPTMADLWLEKLLEQVRRTCKATKQEGRAAEIEKNVKSSELNWIDLADMELHDIKESFNVSLRFAELLRKSARGDRDRLLAGGTVFKCTICVKIFAYEPAVVMHMGLEHGASSEVKQEVVDLEDEDAISPPFEAGDAINMRMCRNMMENVWKYDSKCVENLCGNGRIDTFLSGGDAHPQPVPEVDAGAGGGEAGGAANGGGLAAGDRGKGGGDV